MKSIVQRSARLICALFVTVPVATASAAQSGYTYTSVDYPGALCTSLWGINDSGDVLGQAAFSVDCTGRTISFVYHSKNGTITALATVPGKVGTAAIGINDAGVIVGGAGDGVTNADLALILRHGAFSYFTHPGSVQTQGRAIGDAGLVTGYSTNDAGIDVPFLYDAANQRFTDIVVPGLSPGSFNVAQGVNRMGEVVGSFRLDAGAAYAGSPAGPYGFSLDRRGVVTLFRVNGYRTRARGITESGRIAGFLTDDVVGSDRGFVATLPARGGFQSLTVTGSDLLDVPGASGTYVEGINEVGVVAGQWFDAAGVTHGFIATPLPRRN
jgi:uncharacterized membrane protein